VLLSRSNVAESWIMKKMAAFDVNAPTMPATLGCGLAMPITTGINGFTADRKACLTDLFTWIAENGEPCEIPVGGSGGGGAGGAGTSGAGSGGTGGT
jgi:hypothetical protein